MTSISVSATIAQTLTPTGPSEIKVCSLINQGVPAYLNLGYAPDGKAWYYVGGISASGTPILATITGNTATVVSGISAGGITYETLILHVVRK